MRRICETLRRDKYVRRLCETLMREAWPVARVRATARATIRLYVSFKLLVSHQGFGACAEALVLIPVYQHKYQNLTLSLSIYIYMVFIHVIYIIYC